MIILRWLLFRNFWEIFFSKLSVNWKKKKKKWAAFKSSLLFMCHMQMLNLRHDITLETGQKLALYIWAELEPINIHDHCMNNWIFPGQLFMQWSWVHADHIYIVHI